MAKSTASPKEAGHSQKADSQRGLAGTMPRPIRITLLGAGSWFTPALLNDVMHIPGIRGGTIALVDIDRQRLALMGKVVSQLVAQHDQKKAWRVVVSVDRRQVLKDTDYLINCIEVNGRPCVRFDNDIPLRYGVDQCIGDTIGPGGLFKALRTGPVWLDILRDVEELCPEALVLNYTNPMNVLCLAAGRTRSARLVGLCHSVQGTGHLLAKRAGIEYQQMEWECAGINHLAWFTKLRHQGRDLYPLLFEKARQDLAGHPTDPLDAKDLVRKDMMLHFGAFITESSGHLSEYLPYYRKRKDVLARYASGGYDGGSSFYADNWPKWRKDIDAQRQKVLRGEKSLKEERTWEYASWIIEAREKDTPLRIHGNVMNCPRSGGGPLIGNLLHDSCVEVACMIDRTGIHPTLYGNLPPQMAAICESNLRMFDLAAAAVICRSKEAAVHALLLDPLCQACCCPAEIKAMALELFKAEKEFLPGFK